MRVYRALTKLGTASAPTVHRSFGRKVTVTAINNALERLRLLKLARRQRGPGNNEWVYQASPVTNGSPSAVEILAFVASAVSDISSLEGNEVEVEYYDASGTKKLVRRKGRNENEAFVKCVTVAMGRAE